MKQHSRCPKATWIRFTVCWLALLAASGCADSGATERFVDQWRLAFNSHDLAAFTALYAEEGNFTVPGMLGYSLSRAQLHQTLDTIWRNHPEMQIVDTRFMVEEDGRIALLVYLQITPPLQKAPKIIPSATFIVLEAGEIRSQLTVGGLS